MASKNFKDLIETWEQVKENYPVIKGDEEIIKNKWEELERSSIPFISYLIK